MNAIDLQSAVERFIAKGGQITTAADRCSAGKAVDAGLVEALRGHSFITEAASALHISTRTVGRIARRHGIRFQSNNSALARMDRPRAEAHIISRLRRLAGSAGREKLAAELGITVGTLRRIAREHGINISTRNKP
jgi:histone H3/H4